MSPKCTTVLLGNYLPFTFVSARLQPSPRQRSVHHPRTRASDLACGGTPVSIRRKRCATLGLLKGGIIVRPSWSSVQSG